MCLRVPGSRAVEKLSQSARVAGINAVLLCQSARVAGINAVLLSQSARVAGINAVLLCRGTRAWGFYIATWSSVTAPVLPLDLCNYV